MLETVSQQYTSLPDIESSPSECRENWKNMHFKKFFLLYVMNYPSK